MKLLLFPIKPMPRLLLSLLQPLVFLTITTGVVSAQQAKPAPAKPAAARPENTATSEAAPGAPEQAVQFKKWEFDASLEARKAPVLSAFRNGNIDSDRAGIERFLKSYYFAAWTDPKTTQRLVNYRNDFLNKDFKEVSGSARNFLLSKSLEILLQMVRDPAVTPAARLNAVLAVGSMNERDGGAGNPIVAYPAALQALLKEYNDESTPAYLRVGALIGILRHAQLGIADVNLKTGTLMPLFIKVIAEGVPNTDRSADEQEILNWSRCRAVEGLQALRVTGPKGEAVGTLLDIVENTNETDEMRYMAIRAIGDIDYAPAAAAGVPFKRIGDAVLLMARFVCVNEEKVIQRNMPLTPGGGMEMMGGGEMGFSGETVVDPRSTAAIVSAIGRIKFAMSAIRNAILGKTSMVGHPEATGVLPSINAADAASGKKFTELARMLLTVMEFLDAGADPKKATARPSPMDMMSSMSGESMAPPVDPKAPKVSLAEILAKLQETSQKIDTIFL